MRLVYRPNHPQANDNGMVSLDVAGYESTNTAPYVISDSMEATRHMADGNHYTSKAKFRQATRAAGCVEVGNEMATVTKPRSRVPLDRARRADDIKRAIYELRSGRRT